MSKLIEAMEAKFTGKIKYELCNNLVVNSDFKEAHFSLGSLVEYKITATYFNGGFCRKDEMPAVMENFVKGFKRDAYSTIVNDLLELERAVYSQEYDKAKSRIRDIFLKIS